MLEFDNKTAVITGGAGAIGSATARALLDKGAQVLLVDTDQAQLDAVSVELASDRLAVCCADVSQAGQVQAYVDKAVQDFGGIDLFYNNAAIAGPMLPICDYPLEDFDQVMSVNVRGIWLGLKYVLPVMRRRAGGSVVISSSATGERGSANLSAYVASKHAVIGIMRCAALECAAYNIRVNCVNPGVVDTRMSRGIAGQAAGGTAGFFEAMRARIPLGRLGQAAEIAGLVCFLFSDASRYCSGAIYPADGGINTGY